MKTLIIPDIHNRVKTTERFVSENESDFDKVIFLGDYFDHFDDSPKIAQETALWLRESLNKKNRIHLIGNHDLPYMFPKINRVWCPGFKPEKCVVINEVMRGRKNFWNLLKVAVWEQGYLLSHAGVDVRHLPYKPNLNTKESLNLLIETVLDSIKKNNPHPLLNLGSRMGEEDVGGIFWQDWYCLNVIEDINQIVGHTVGSFPRFKYIHKDGKAKSLDASGNTKRLIPKDKNVLSRTYCLDVQGECAGILEDGRFSFLNVKTGKKLDLEVLENNVVNENLSNNGWNC